MRDMNRRMSTLPRLQDELDKVITAFFVQVFVQLNRTHLSSEPQTYTEGVAPCTASVNQKAWYESV